MKFIIASLLIASSSLLEVIKLYLIMIKNIINANLLINIYLKKYIFYSN